MKSYNMILTEKQQKYQHYNLCISNRWRNTTSDWRRVIKQAKFTYSSLENALEKQRQTIEDQEKNKLNWTA